MLAPSAALDRVFDELAFVDPFVSSTSRFRIINSSFSLTLYTNDQVNLDATGSARVLMSCFFSVFKQKKARLGV